MRTNSRRNHEQGIVILLVAVVLLFVVGAMAAFAIDVVAFYTARSEAQLAADGAALAGARVLANSGMTSDPANAGPVLNAEDLARAIEIQVARSNQVGGRLLNAGEVTATINDTEPTNPRVTVQAGRADIPTFFARIGDVRPFRSGHRRQRRLITLQAQMPRRIRPRRRSLA